ncbi:MAG: polyribonucleotide nucleotidyltransferase [Clostridia bacterium]|nr:polyribonucleotide nucleotidyltransferase [Clostridia bacterium]
MFEKHRVFETQIAGRKLEVQTGKLSQLANGSCLVKYGDTVVHVAVTASKTPREGIDFFPLSVDFEERLYSVGKIPGSFSKREGKPSEKAILASRVIDRPIRPLFPKDLKNDVSVSCTVMSVDNNCSPEITAMIGTSVALSISDIPWNGPISGCQIGMINNKFIVNPSFEELQKSDLCLTVASTGDLVSMIEAGANQVPDNIMYDAIVLAHEENKKVINFIENIKLEIGKDKFDYEKLEIPEELLNNIEEYIKSDLELGLYTPDKNTRDENINKIYEKAHAKFDEIYIDNPENIKIIDECVYKLQKKIVRNWLLKEQKRVDGRKLDEIRELHAEVDLLPRVHGSGLFTRGQTQVLTVLTLGPISDGQILDGIDPEESKRYMHHYNFPSYSVGETKPSRGPGRREIGHGALAERALVPVIPTEQEFPYSLRLVSEVLSSNGSTSQGSVCGSTLALMAGGVPIKAPVAGISCGLVFENKNNWITMVDIQGIEDFFGDMDFKVAGTHTGITAIQMDIKINGLTLEIIKEALEKTKVARINILNNVILKAIDRPRKNLSEYAPKVVSIKIPVDKIREVIGTGGKTVQKICTDFDVKVDIEESGDIYVLGVDISKCYQALDYIKDVITEPQVGQIYMGKVSRIMEFGAFIEFGAGKEGLCHISHVDHRRIGRISDVLEIGQPVKVRIIEIDPKGRINLSIKEA